MTKFKQQIDERTAALSLGLLFAVMHLAGIALTAAYGARWIMSIQSLHFVAYPFTVLPVTGLAAIEGIIAAFIAGAVIGWVFAAIWNLVATAKFAPAHVPAHGARGRRRRRARRPAAAFPQ